MKKILFPNLTSLPYLFLLLATPILAQKTGAPAPVTEKQSVPVKLPYCDELTTIYGKDLQKRANQECRTVYPCIECEDRVSKKATCNQIVVQPNKDARCGVMATVKGDPKNAETNKTPLDPNDFALTIIQTPCCFGGITLNVLANRTVSTLADPPGAYRYSWTVDDVPVATSHDANCVSGKSATVKVTQIETGRMKSMTVEITSGMQDKQAPNVPTKPIAMYQKISCFGSCPAYTVEFYKDGAVHWNGLANIIPLGSKRGKITLDAFAKIVEKARAIDFLKLNNSYPEDKIEDAATTVIYLNIDGKDKQVTDVFDAPKGLDELEKMFDDMIQKLGWAKTPLQVKNKAAAPVKTIHAADN